MLDNLTVESQNSSNKLSKVKHDLPLSASVVSEIESQRKKLELEIIKENYLNEVNRHILYICHSDGKQETPFRKFKYERFKRMKK